MQGSDWVRVWPNSALGPSVSTILLPGETGLISYIIFPGLQYGQLVMQSTAIFCDPRTYSHCHTNRLFSMKSFLKSLIVLDIALKLYIYEERACHIRLLNPYNDHYITYALCGQSSIPWATYVSPQMGVFALQTENVKCSSEFEFFFWGNNKSIRKLIYFHLQVIEQ